MTPRERNGHGIIDAYRQYKVDARGWGVPDVKDFRERLWPLRGQRDKD